MARQYETFYSEDDLHNIKTFAQQLVGQIATVLHLTTAVENSYGFPPLKTFADMETAVQVATTMKRSPGAPIEILTSEEWNAPPADATQLIAHGREFSQLKDQVDKHFNSDALEQSHAEDIAYVQKKSEGFLSFLSFLDSRYRAIKRRWQSYRLPAFNASMMELAQELKTVDRLLTERNVISSSNEKGRRLFGELWQGGQSSWDVLDTYVEWVVELLREFLKYAETGRLDITIASLAADTDSPLERDVLSELTQRG